MNQEEEYVSIEEIAEVFDNIPAQKILQTAKNIQGKLIKGESEGEAKGTDEGEWDWRTEADTLIQNIILEYFESSPLKGTYKIKAEEELDKSYNEANAYWQLVIDPLDGTSPFSKGKETWGVMIGACDSEGILIYSWNLVSSGEIYSSKNEGRDKENQKNKKVFSERIKEKGQIAIDVYDYKSGASEKFGSVFEEIIGIKNNEYTQTSYPAAVWAGWQLYNGELDGMLWLPSDQGKKWYPDYDLSFLGALEKKGMAIRIGKLKDESGKMQNAMIVIAPTDEDVEKLVQTGYSLITEKQKQNMKITELPAIIN